VLGALSLSVVMLGPGWMPPHPRGVIEEGRYVPEHDAASINEAWLRDALDVHARTQWTIRAYPAAHGGAVVVASEHVGKVPVWGAQLALRIDPHGRLRQVIGVSLPKETELPPEAAVSDRTLRWWPVDGRLELGRVETHGPATDGTAERRLVRLSDGHILTRQPAAEAGLVDIEGWPENPISTPTTQSYSVALIDADPIVLETAENRVVQCGYVDGKCAIEIGPTADDPAEFATPPPGVEDAEAHAALGDPWSAPQAMHYVERASAKFQSWGWDPDVWDVVDCEWQGVPPEECKFHVYVNVLRAGEDGPARYDGANARDGRMFLGQGKYGDTAFDMQLVAHELTHHVSQGYGSAEMTEAEYEWDFWRNDWVAINEGSADLMARFATESDELFQYFRNYLGVYQGPLKRDVSIPFRCPENITGEVHMEGRIWASAWHDVHLALQAEGLAGPDDFPSIMRSSLPALRQLPSAERRLFARGTRIVLDEIGLTLGSTAEAIATEIVEERGLLECSYVIDIASEPSARGPVDPDDPYDARFIMLRTYGSATDPETVTEHPHAAPVQHRLTVRDQQHRVSLHFVPDLWDRTKLAEEPIEHEGLEIAALVKVGGELVEFRYDPEAELMFHDADYEVAAEPAAERGEEWRQIVFDELEEGETYTIAIITSTPVDDFRLVLRHLDWTIDSEYAPAPADGCACGTSSSGSAWWLAVLLLPHRRRRC
jgi:hypothetical protein